MDTCIGSACDLRGLGYCEIDGEAVRRGRECRLLHAIEARKQELDHYQACYKQIKEENNP